MENLISYLQRGLINFNAFWVMWILIALMAVSFAITLERWVLLFGVRANISGLSEGLERKLERLDYAGASELLETSKSPAAAVVLEGLRHRAQGAVSASEWMVGATALQRRKLERGLAFLGTLGNNAPFIGLLGTVLGVIKSFESLGRATTDAATRFVMAGVAEALVATAVGLMVALPAVAAYNYFQRRIHSSMVDTTALRGVLMAHLASTGSQSAGHAAPGAPSIHAVPEPQLRLGTLES